MLALMFGSSWISPCLLLQTSITTMPGVWQGLSVWHFQNHPALPWEPKPSDVAARDIWYQDIHMKPGICRGAPFLFDADGLNNVGACSKACYRAMSWLFNKTCYESNEEAVVLQKTMPDGQTVQWAIGPCYMKHYDEPCIFPWFRTLDGVKQGWPYRGMA